MSWVCKRHEVSYQVENPEWVRLDDILVLASGIAPRLKEAMDRSIQSGPVAWTGGRAEEIFAKLATWKSQAVMQADMVVDEIRAARDAQSQQLTKTDVEWKREWVADDV